MNAHATIPLSEQYERAALDHVDAEAAAQLLEETRSAFLAELMADIVKDDPKMPVSRAEMQAKASEEWRAWNERMIKARKLANRMKVKREVVRMKFSEWMAADANHRTAARM